MDFFFFCCSIFKKLRTYTHPNIHALVGWRRNGYLILCKKIFYMNIVHNGHSIFPISEISPTKKMQIWSVTQLATHISQANISRRGLFSRKENNLIIGGGLSPEDDFNLKPPGRTPPYLLWSHLEANLTWEPQLIPAALWEGVPSSQPNRGGRLHKANLKTVGPQESQGGLSMPGVCDWTPSRSSWRMLVWLV